MNPQSPRRLSVGLDHPNFPIEIIERIFNILDYNTLHTISFVSKLWSQIVARLKLTPPFYRQKYFIEFGELVQEGDNPSWARIFKQRRFFRGKQKLTKQELSGKLILDEKYQFQNDFPTVILNVTVWNGKFYYEVEILKAEDPSRTVGQFGWATLEFAPQSALGSGVGDCPYSYSIDAFREITWHNKINEPTDHKFEIGERIGVGLDLETNQIHFYSNGIRIAGFSGFPGIVRRPFIPAISFTRTMSVRFWVHEHQLKFLPSGYNSLTHNHQRKKLKLFVVAEKKFAVSTSIDPKVPIIKCLPVFKKLVKDTAELLDRLSNPEVPTLEKLSVARSVAMLHDINIPTNVPVDQQIESVYEEVAMDLWNAEWSCIVRYVTEVKEQHKLSIGEGASILSSLMPCTKEEHLFFIDFFLMTILLDPNPPPNHPFYAWLHTSVADNGILGVTHRLFFSLANIAKISKKSELTLPLPKRGKVNYEEVKNVLGLVSDESLDALQQNILAVIQKCVDLSYVTSSQTVPGQEEDLSIDFHMELPQLKKALKDRLIRLAEEIETQRSALLRHISTSEIQSDLEHIKKGPSSQNITNLLSESSQIFEKYEQPLCLLYTYENHLHSLIVMLNDELRLRQKFWNRSFYLGAVVVVVVGALFVGWRKWR